MNNFQYPADATPLDPDEMDGLKFKHITTREELNRFEQDNINEALQWLENRRKSDILTEKFVKTLHIENVRQGVALGRIVSALR